ncbi:MAG: HAMP domain-containing protein [Chitinophagaceae bacterium]|nr:HAMP domain-containing protein [Chitinophagaceae bacterium]
MAIKLKTKVALGSIFLFVLLIIVGAISFYFLNRITEETGQIVKDNYESLNYSRLMLNELNNHPDSAFDKFEQMLQLQEKNITEPGEREMTVSLRKNFNMLRSRGMVDSLPVLIRNDVSNIMHINLVAIDKKKQTAQASAEKAKTIITICLTVCLLIGFTFLYNFPSSVAGPIASLTEGIKAIADKNYGQRIHLNRKDEFGELATAFNSMAERLDQYEHSNLSLILFEKQRAETVINTLKDASIGIDNKGTILFANRQALQLLSLKEQDIVGQPQKDVERRNDLFRFLVNEQTNTPFKIVVDNKENYFTKEIMDIQQQNEKAGVVIVLKNITPFKELDTAKTNFMATISHELKTPLSSSDFSLKLLEDERVGTLNDEQKELVQSLKEDNKRLLKILSELLDLSQVESGKLELNIQKISPYNIIGKAEQFVVNAAKNKNISIRKEIAENLGLIDADEEKLIWVLNNFLTNAIKHSYDNGIVAITVKQEASNLIFAVTDNGKGIEEKYLPRLFDRYFKVPGTSEKSGTGLGLAISKDFIEAHGGSINVFSSLGAGSTFSFSLPVKH